MIYNETSNATTGMALLYPHLVPGAALEAGPRDSTTGSRSRMQTPPLHPAPKLYSTLSGSVSPCGTQINSSDSRERQRSPSCMSHTAGTSRSSYTHCSSGHYGIDVQQEDETPGAAPGYTARAGRIDVRSSGRGACDMRSLTGLLTQCDGTVSSVGSILSSTEPEFVPRLPGLTKLMGKFTRDGEWKKALAIFDSLSVLRLLPDTPITNAAIAACDKGGDWVKAKEIFDRMDRLGLKRDTITYSSTISALSKSGDWATAAHLFLCMCDAGVRADAVTCCSLINVMDRADLWQVSELILLSMCCRMPAFTDLRALDPPDLSCMLPRERLIVNSLCMQLSGEATGREAGVGRADRHRSSGDGTGHADRSRMSDGSGRFPSGAVSGMRTADGLAMHMQQLHFNTHRHGARGANQSQHSSQGQPRGGPSQLSPDMPNRVCCNALLASYSRASPPQWHRAVTLINCMLRHSDHLSPDTVSFNTALRAVSSVGRLQEAYSLYNSMAFAGVKETAATMAALMATAVAAGQPLVALGVWDSMQGSSLRPTAACATAKIDALLQMGKRQEAREFFHSLIKGALHPTFPSGDCAALLMRDHLCHGEPAAAANVFKLLSNLPSRPSPTQALVSAAAEAFALSARWPEAASAVAFGASAGVADASVFAGVVGQLVSASMQPDGSGANQVVVQTAMDLLDIMLTLPTTSHFPAEMLDGCMFLASCAKDARLAVRTAATAHASGLPLSADYLQLALITCMHRDFLPELVSTMSAPERQQAAPNAPVATLLFAAACLLRLQTSNRPSPAYPSATSSPSTSPFPLRPSCPALTAPWYPGTVHSVVALLCDVGHAVVAIPVFWAALVVMAPWNASASPPPGPSASDGAVAAAVASAHSSSPDSDDRGPASVAAGAHLHAGADKRHESGSVAAAALSSAMQNCLMRAAASEEVPHLLQVFAFSCDVFAAGGVISHESWNAGCSFFLQTLTRIPQLTDDVKALSALVKAMASQGLAPDAPTAAALLSVGVHIPESALPTLLRSPSDPTAVLFDLIHLATSAPSGMPRAVRIARAAHAAAVLHFYDAPAPSHPPTGAKALPARKPLHSATAHTSHLRKGSGSSQRGHYKPPLQQSPPASPFAAAPPLRVLNLSGVPSALVAPVTLAWLAEIAASGALQDPSVSPEATGSDGPLAASHGWECDDSPYVVITGTREEPDAGFQGKGSSLMVGNGVRGQRGGASRLGDPGSFIQQSMDCVLTVLSILGAAPPTGRSQGSQSSRATEELPGILSAPHDATRRLAAGGPERSAAPGRNGGGVQVSVASDWTSVTAAQGDLHRWLAKRVAEGRFEAFGVPVPGKGTRKSSGGERDG